MDEEINKVRTAIRRIRPRLLHLQNSSSPRRNSAQGIIFSLPFVVSKNGGVKMSHPIKPRVLYIDVTRSSCLKDCALSRADHMEFKDLTNISGLLCAQK